MADYGMGRPVETVSTGFDGIDEMLGGGLRRGSFTSLMGQSGTGKTTLAVQVAGNLAREGGKTLYMTVETGAQHMRVMAREMGEDSPLVAFYDHMDIRTFVETVLRRMDEEHPDLVILDGLSLLPFGDGRADAIRDILVRAGEATYKPAVLAVEQLARPVGLPEGTVTMRAHHHYADAVAVLGQEDGETVLRTAKNRFGNADGRVVLPRAGRGFVNRRAGQRYVPAAEKEM